MTIARDFLMVAFKLNDKIGIKSELWCPSPLDHAVAKVSRLAHAVVNNVGVRGIPDEEKSDFVKEAHCWAAFL